MTGSPRLHAPRLSPQPSAVLLAVQLDRGLSSIPSSKARSGVPSCRLFGLVVLFIAVRTVQSTPALTWVAIVLGVPIVVFTILEVLEPLDQTVVLWSSVLHAAFYFYTSYALVRYMFRDHIVTPTSVCATSADLHRPRLGVRLHVHGRAGHLARLVQRRASNPLLPRSWFELPVPVVHEPDQRRPVGHRAGAAECPLRRDDRAGRRSDVRRESDPRE